MFRRYTDDMTTLKIQVPDVAAGIPDLDKSISWFVEEQIRIARWRKGRYDDRVDEIVESAIGKAHVLKEGGMTPEEARAEFVRRCREIGE